MNEHTLRTNFIVPFVGLLLLNLPSVHSQVSLQSPPDAVNFDANYMSTQLVHQVDPDFPWTPHTPNEAAPMCPFNVVLGVDGTVQSVDPPKPYGSLCAEPYFSSAKRAVRLWTWKPQFKNGVPVRVSTSVTVRFDATSTSPVSILDPTQQTAVSIELKSGSTIPADTIKQEGKNVSYTIGEDSYEIPADMVEKILKQEPPASNVALSPSAGRAGKPTGCCISRGFRAWSYVMSGPLGWNRSTCIRFTLVGRTAGARDTSRLMRVSALRLKGRAGRPNSSVRF